MIQHGVGGSWFNTDRWHWSSQHVGSVIWYNFSSAPTEAQRHLCGGCFGRLYHGELGYTHIHNLDGHLYDNIHMRRGLSTYISFAVCCTIPGYSFTKPASSTKFCCISSIALTELIFQRQLLVPGGTPCYLSPLFPHEYCIQTEWARLILCIN